MEDKVNVIYIHTHDSGILTGAYGYGPENSEIKKFAKDSLVFRKAFSTSPTCSPSRSSLLTGMYPHQNGMLGLTNRGFKLNNYEDHLVRILNNNGYYTVLSGIQHEAARYTQPAKGAEIIGYNENISEIFDMSDEKELHKWDRLNSEKAAKWIGDYSREEPLFLSVGLFSTHRPYPLDVDKTVEENYISVPQFLPDNYDTREDYSKYLESLKIADDCFGEIINALKNNGMYDNSIILFTTDHGIAMPFSKCNLTDQGTNVSFVMKTPWMKNKGRVTESLISQVDFVPTILDLLKIDTGKELAGFSFAELFDNEMNEIRDSIFTEVNYHASYEPMRSVRTKRFKYIKYFDEENKNVNLSNIDNSKTKSFLVENGLTDIVKEEEYLFDLYFDPTEKKNLVANNEYSNILEELRRKVLNQMYKTNDLLLKGRIEKKDSWKVNKITSLEPSPKDDSEYL